MSALTTPPGHPGRVREFGHSRILVFIRRYQRAEAITTLAKLEAAHQAGREYGNRRRAEMRGGPPAGPPPEAVDTFALHDIVILYSCLAIESFLNFYGTARLGERFFKRFVERISNTEQKVAIIIGMSTGFLVEGDADIFKVVRDLFARRGALVHPKAREVIRIPEDLPRAIQANVIDHEDARRSVADMVQFFDLMAQYDPDVGAFLAEEDYGDDDSEDFVSEIDLPDLGLDAPPPVE